MRCNKTHPKLSLCAPPLRTTASALRVDQRPVRNDRQLPDPDERVGRGVDRLLRPRGASNPTVRATVRPGCVLADRAQAVALFQQWYYAPGQVGLWVAARAARRRPRRVTATPAFPYGREVLGPLVSA